MIAVLLAAALLVPSPTIEEAFGSRSGALVLIDTTSGETQRFHPELAAQPFAPCSTFKIWNTAIGLETGLLERADQPFWHWDGVQRSIADGAWNRNLTLREAFAVSCVPAYQNLARAIGQSRMDDWLQRLGYGNRDTASGLNVFWLPASDRKALRITADEQAELMRRLVRGDVPFSPRTLAVLQTLMEVEKTGRGTLYGKTGTSGSLGGSQTPHGWWVGYLVTGRKTVAFAALVTGEGASGKEARGIVEKIFRAAGML